MAISATLCFPEEPAFRVTGRGEPSRGVEQLRLAGTDAEGNGAVQRLPVAPDGTPTACGKMGVPSFRNDRHAAFFAPSAARKSISYFSSTPKSAGASRSNVRRPGRRRPRDSTVVAMILAPNVDSWCIPANTLSPKRGRWKLYRWRSFLGN